MKESKLFKSLVATFVIIVLGGPTVVLADTPSHYDFVEDDKVAVSYTDLNLESEESVRVLYRRLKRASSNLCSATPPRIAGSVPIYYFDIYGRETRQCYREALSSAVDKVDNEDLTRIHAG